MISADYWPTMLQLPLKREIGEAISYGDSLVMYFSSYALTNRKFCIKKDFLIWTLQLCLSFSSLLTSSKGGGALSIVHL